MSGGANTADPGTEFILMEIDPPYSNHNAGRSGNSDILLIDVGGPTATTTSRWGHIKAMFK